VAGGIGSLRRYATTGGVARVEFAEETSTNPAGGCVIISSHAKSLRCALVCMAPSLVGFAATHKWRRR